MKYGIDINNTEILKAISQKLKESGNFIVDLYQGQSTARSLLKKVLIANITNIDFYVGIEFKKDISQCEIFYDNNEKSKECSEMVNKLLNENIKNIICKQGDHLYLLKNINAPALYVKIPVEAEETIEQLYIEGIVDILNEIPNRE